MRLSVNHVAEIYVTEQRQRARVEEEEEEEEMNLLVWLSCRP